MLWCKQIQHGNVLHCRNSNCSSCFEKDAEGRGVNRSQSHKNTMRSMAGFLTFVVLLGMFCSASGVALADGDSPDSGRWRRAQGQLVLFSSLSQMEGFFAGQEIVLNASVLSLGVAGGVRYERVGSDSGGDFHGFHVNTAFQWRPFQLLPWRFYRYLDLHGDFGYLAGKLWSKEESRLRFGLFFGLGLDGGVPLWNNLRVEKRSDGKLVEKGGVIQLVLSVGYRYFLLNRPDMVPVHEMQFGVGIRGTL